MVHSHLPALPRAQEKFAGLDFGTLRVCDSKSLPLVFKNSGKYPVNYAFMLKSARVRLRACLRPPSFKSFWGPGIGVAGKTQPCPAQCTFPPGSAQQLPNSPRRAPPTMLSLCMHMCA